MCRHRPWISYPELWGHPRALGFGFDRALDGLAPDPSVFCSANLVTELAVVQSSAAIVASRSQLRSFPEPLQQRLIRLPEGVDLNRIKPDPRPACPFPSSSWSSKPGSRW